jgi:hypothetical protein
MTQSTNILNELKELNSSLPGASNQNIYTVPAGYFEGLAGELMNRIRAMEAASAKEELSFLSPVLNDISRQMPYSVPNDYFISLAERAVINTKQTATEELESISPFLNALKKENPYAVPHGYFDTLGVPVKADMPEIKVISITSRKWFRYAAAAVVTGLVVVAGLFIYSNQNDPGRSIARLEKKINKEIKSSSDKELNEFLQYTDAGLDGTEKVSVSPDSEAKELLKDIPDSELKEFLEETSEFDTGTDNLLMN